MVACRLHRIHASHHLFVCLFFCRFILGKEKGGTPYSLVMKKIASVYIFSLLFSQGNNWRVLYQSRALLVDPTVLFSINTLRSLKLVTFGVLGLVKYDQEVMGFRYESL